MSEWGDGWRYNVTYEAIALSPDARYLAAAVPVPGPGAGWPEPGLVLVVHDLVSGQDRRFDEVMDPRRLHYAPDGSLLFALGREGTRVTEIALSGEGAPRTYDTAAAYASLDVSPDGQHMVLWNPPAGVPLGCETPGRCTLAVVDRAAGRVSTIASPHPIHDVDFSSVHSGELIVTTRDSAQLDEVVAHTLFIDAATGERRAEVTLPNCAGELVLHPEGRLGLMAPNRCGPENRPALGAISVLDLESRAFVRNLPGFGPVQFASDGHLAVGYTRRTTMRTQWDYPQKIHVGLVVVDLPSLEWRVLEVGGDFLLVEGGERVLACGLWDMALVDLVTASLTPVSLPPSTPTTGRPVVDASEERVWRLSLFSGVVELDTRTAAATVSDVSVGGSRQLLIGGPGSHGPRRFQYIVGDQFAPEFVVVSETERRSVSLSTGPRTPPTQ